MLKYFIKKIDDIDYPVKEYSRFDWVRRKYLFELEKVKNYYRYRIRATNNKNILSKLIDLLRTDITKDEFDYYKYVDSNAEYIAKQLNIVNDLSSGKVLESEIYGDNSYEILLSVNNDIDFDYIANNWIELETLRVIKTDNVQLNFTVPFENIDMYIDTLTIFEIDIVTMLLQYRHWALERMSNDDSIDPNVFIATIVYPNVLNNMIDLTIFNRYMNIALDIEQYTELDNKNPFLIIDYNDKVNNILKEVVKDTKNRNIYLTQLLKTIPSIYNNNMIEALHINKDIFNIRSYWVLVVARLKIVLNLIKILDKHGMKRNKDLINRIPVDLKEIERRSSYVENKLPILFEIELQETINELNNLLGKR